MSFPIPDAALAAHTAVLGKTGAGKTTAAKGIVEHLVASGTRACILDPIKSDWWGLTSSADGRRAGLPFHILGGPRGHVPLHASSGKVLAEIVANGDLPLSILDMAFFEPGGLAQFFIDFAPVLLRRMRGVLHLVMEEAHLFAPKERSGIGNENMAIHWAKMLATAGRSKGIRLILATQRTQSLHNALLGSCETMIALRLTAPADQAPLKDWLKANVAKDITEEVSSSLAGLKTGTGWVCSGEAKFFDLVEFPRLKTYDNTATPTGDMERAEVRTAPVDVDKLRAIVGDAAKEAEANDPRLLRAEIGKLKAQIGKISAAKPSESVAKVNTADLEAARVDGYERGRAHERAHSIEKFTKPITALIWSARADLKKMEDLFLGPFEAVDFDKHLKAPVPRAPRLAPAKANGGDGVALRSTAHPIGIGKKPVSRRLSKASIESVEIDIPLSNPQRQIIAALAWWRAMGHDEVTRAQLAAKARFKVSGGHFLNRLSELARADYIAYPRSNFVTLTPAGATAAPEPDLRESVAATIRSTLSNPQAKLFDVMLDKRVVTREELAREANFEAGGGHFLNRLSELARMEIITFPQRGQVELQDWVTP